MKREQFLGAILSAVFAFAVFLPTARADETNERTEITFDQPVEIPGHVLPPGTYWFLVVDNTAGRDVVRVFGPDFKTIYATVITTSAERMTPANRTTLIFAERESSRPQTLLSWFYPGSTIGHEFLYSASEEQELGKDKRDIVVATPMTSNQINAGY